MVIGYLTSVYARAADTFIRNEVLELRRRGHVVHTFSIRRPDPDEAVSDDVRAEQQTTDYVLRRGAAALLLAFAASCLRRPRATLAAARLAWQTRAPGLRALTWQLAYLVEASYLAQRIRENGIEHLHNHIGENSAAVAMLAARIAGIPYSLTVHGPGEFQHPVRLALGEKIRRAAFTVAISHFGRSQCMLAAPSEAWPRIHVVRCGLDEAFLAAPAAPVPAEPRLLSVGRLAVQKGYPLLLEAVARLRDEGVACELLLVGDGPLRQELESLIDRLDLRARARIGGWKSSEAVRAELLRSRALVLPSLAEGLPVALMEALALARPVISTRVAGIPELVEDGAEGWLVAPGSSAALADALREALSCPREQLERMGRAGAERVRRDHSLRRQVAELERLMRAPPEPGRA